MDPNASLLDMEDVAVTLNASQSSSDSAEFNFATKMNLRMNLTEKFEEHLHSDVNHSSPSFSAVGSLVTTVPEESSVAASSISDRIAQFEQGGASSAVATSLGAATVRPPLPSKLALNATPTDGVSVYLRIRPPFSKSSKHSSAGADKGRTTLEILDPVYPNVHPTTVRTYPPPSSNASKIHREDSSANFVKQYEFHQVLGAETSQKSAYDAIAAPLVHDICKAATSSNSTTKEDSSSMMVPGSALIFAYGITNAGKTHTILGDVKSKDSQRWGVIPRALSDMFDHMKQLSNSSEYELHISYLEVYNEQIYDLIPKKSSKYQQNFGPPNPLKIRESRNQTLVRGLAKHRVRDVHHGIELTMAANARRHTSSNNLNEDSSRSHCVCQLQLVKKSRQTMVVNNAEADDASTTAGYSTDDEVVQLSRHNVATLWIVDLAGSERAKRTGLSATGQKQASMINKSLLTLMRCLSAMRENSKHSSGQVVPFRESKLTQLFMTHLTGPSAARTAMVVNVNPSVADFDETQHVLAYASKAKNIKMKPEDMVSKQRHFYGDEYGLDGRKRVAGKAHAIGKKISKVAKALSPKKFLDKRKNQVGTMEAAQEPPSKKARNLPQEDTSTLKAQLSAATAEAKSLKLELTISQAEVESLKAELSQKETLVREEVYDEVSDQMMAMKNQYEEIINRLQSQVEPATSIDECRSTRKAEQDVTKRQIEELMDKVVECEDEMVRMRQDHQAQVSVLTSQLAEEQGKRQASSRLENKVEELQKELEASQEQVAALKKVKVEIVENYEQLLKEQKEKASNTENSQSSSPFRETISKMTTRVSRKPLRPFNIESPGGDSVSSSTSKKNQQLLYPKRSSVKDSSGLYKRPMGRAPTGRDWDANVGAWRLSSATPTM